MKKICIVSTIKAPLNELIFFVNYHLNIGIDKIIFFFDDPNDTAISYFNKYSQVTCISCDESHWEKYGNPKPLTITERQIVNVNIGMEIAKNKDYQWMIHIDSDEIIYPCNDLKKILSECAADVLRFTINEAVPEDDYYNNIFSATLFKKPERSIQRKIATLLGCSKVFFEGEYFRGHSASKVAVRISSKIEWMGIHKPKAISKDSIFKNTQKIKLLHFDCIGVNAWKSKFIGRIDGSAKSKIMRDNRKKQLELFADAFNRNDDAILKLYHRLYRMPKYEQIILRLLNMLTVIRIDRDLFNSPEMKIPDTRLHL